MVGALTAVGLVVLEAEEAGGAQLREQLVGGERAAGLPLVDMRRDLVGEEVPKRLAKQVVFRREPHDGRR